MRVQFEPSTAPGSTSTACAATLPERPATSAWRGGCWRSRKAEGLIQGALNIDVPAVISNHPDLGMLADTYSVPFRHIPVTPETKADAEKQLLSAIGELNINLVVLARYMQILSSGLCRQLKGRAINIHHSMLPSFKGARPYQQAYGRGVKVIGATAHYVTPDLDEGPIIEQAVTRINHTMTAAQVTQLGRDNECLALSRAVQWHTENRILLDGRRTVVFH